MRLRWVATACVAMVVGLVVQAGTALGQATSNGATAASDNPLLGFSRYLPADTRGYISALQLGKLRSEIAASNAWGRVAAIPEVSEGLSEVRKALAGEELPPPVRAAIDLAKSATETEMTFAVSGDATQDTLNLTRAILTSFVVLAPSPHEADTPEGFQLERKRAPLRVEWTAAVPKTRIPSVVFAARVKDAAKQRAFVEAMLDLGWQAASAEIDKKALPQFREPLKKAYSHVKIGEQSLIRFRLRAGDVVPLEGLAEGLDRTPLGEDEKQVIAKAIENFTIDVHIGFLGDYLTLVIGSDDRFIKQIVERFDGRSQETLAASTGFATIRAELAPSSFGIVYADNADLQRELQSSIMPLVNKLADPDLHKLLGVPPEFTAGVQRVQFLFETGVLTTPLRQEAVVKVDHGLKQYLRTEFDRDPGVVATKPLATLAMIPEQAIAYSLIRDGSLENGLEQLKYVFAQQRAQLESFRTRFGDDAPDIFKSQLRLIDALETSIDEKFMPSLRGEMGFVLGGFADFGVKEGKGPAIRGVPIPTIAMLVHSARADLALEGVRDIFTAITDIVKAERRGEDLPVEFVKHDLDGIETWIFKSELMIVDGIEPHFAKIDGALVFSTSYELTKKMRDAARGKSPAIGASPAHEAMKELLPVGAEQASFFNGEEFNRSLRASATAVFRLLDKSPELFNLRGRDLEQLATVKRAVEMGLSLAECLRGSASSVVREGRFDVLREWVKIEDLQAK